MIVTTKPICPADCDALDIEVLFDECSPEFESGQIERVYVAKANAPDFTDVEDLAEWTARLGVDIFELKVIGDMPEPESTEIPWVDGEVVNGDKKFTANFRILEVNDTNYQFMRSVQCNTRYKFWFATAGGKMYGGNAGITAQFKGSFMIPEDRADITKLMFVTKWTDSNFPDRSVSPF